MRTGAKMLPKMTIEKTTWLICDDEGGRTVLRYPCKSTGEDISCPQCGTVINIQGIECECDKCARKFDLKSGFLTSRSRVGRHENVYGSWARNRPFSRQG